MLSETGTNNPQEMLEQAANKREYKGLEDHLKAIKKQLENKPSEEVLRSAEQFINALRAKKEEFEKQKDYLSDETQTKLKNLKDEFELSQDIQDKLDILKITKELDAPKELKLDGINLKSALGCLSKVKGSDFKAWETVGYERQGLLKWTSEINALNALNAEYDSNVGFSDRVKVVITKYNLGEVKAVVAAAPIQAVKIEAVDSKVAPKVAPVDVVAAAPKSGVDTVVSKTAPKVEVSKEVEAGYTNIFKSFLGLNKNEYNDTRIVSFINVFKNVDGNTKEDWEKVGYTHEGMRFTDSELERLNKLKEKYNSNGVFAKKLDKVINYPNKATDPEYKNFKKFIKEQGFKTELEDSTYDVEQFDTKNIGYVNNYISDINGDGKVESKNIVDTKWYYLWLTGDKAQGQNLSETLMKETLDRKFKNVESLNVLLKRFGIDEIRPETTKEELTAKKEQFWKKLVEKMTILGSNGKLEGFNAILDGKEKEFMNNKLNYEENLDKDIDRVLLEKEPEIKAKIAELKDQYGLEKADSTDDIKRIKELLKGTIKQNSEIQWGIFAGSINTNGAPKGGDLLGQVIKALDMGKYSGILGFYVSKKIYETENKKGQINIGAANFIPYISANYAATIYNENKDKIGKAAELKGNYTIVPFAALSPLSVSAGVGLNFNDKNRAINEHINITSEIFNKSENNSYITLGEKGKLVIDEDKIIEKYGIKDNEEAKKNLKEILSVFEGYYNDYKTGNKELDLRLLNHLKTSTVNFVSNELYRENKGWNVSGVTLGMLFSILNPATFASFIGINFQTRTQKFEEESENIRQADKSKALSGAAMNGVEATNEELAKLNLKSTILEKEGQKYSVYEYTGKLRNFYAGDEVQIEEIGNKIYISGKVESIIKAYISDNTSSEECLSFNGETEKSEYKTKITESLHKKPSVVKSTKETLADLGGLGEFKNKKQITEIMNKLFEKSNSLRYKKSFINFQNSVADMYKTGNLDDAWNKLGIFAKELPKSQGKQIIDFMNSINSDTAEKEKVMKSILGLTAGDWRIRLFKELHEDTAWAKEERKRLGLKKDFTIGDIKDKDMSLIESRAIRKAEEENLIRFFEITDDAEKQELRNNFDTYYTSYNKINKLGDQKEKKLRVEKDTIVFQNFTQMDAKGRRTFHNVIATYGDEEIHDGTPCVIDDQKYKNKFVDKIPNTVLVSKFDQILAKLEANKVSGELLTQMKGIKDDTGKIEFIKEVLKGENKSGLKGSFDLSFVRWNTCLNSAYMISNMKFALDAKEIETGMPKIGTLEYNTAALTQNESSEGVVALSGIITNPKGDAMKKILTGPGERLTNLASGGNGTPSTQVGSGHL